jgi:hypothetical protein
MREKRKVREPEREAGEVEVLPGKHLLPPTAFAEHGEEHDNDICAYKVVHAAMLAVELLPNDAARGAYYLPPPRPIRDTVRTP